MKLKKLMIILTVLLVATTTFAAAPVVDLTQSDQDAPTSDTSFDQSAPEQTPQQEEAPAPAPDYSRMSMGERIARLEQQTANISQMNLPAQISQLQQQVQQLQGQLDLQAHQLQTMQDQQKNFYQDLNQQLAQLKAGPNTTATNPKPAANLSAPVVSGIGSLSEQADYQNAFNALQNKKYDVAVTGFNNYLQQYPKGQFAVNAHYWLGEVYFLKNKLDLSAQQFQAVVNQYPKDQKVPDAMLKLAFISDNQGKKDEAKKSLQQIIKKYPGTPAAQLASLRLKSES